MKKTKKICFLLFLFTLILSLERSPKKTGRENPSLFLIAQTTFEKDKSFSLQDGYLKVIFPPIQIFPRTFSTLRQRREILEYEVKKGETIESIAKKFDLEEETILWANNLEKNHSLKEGEKLIILPVDGILHQVKPGETLYEIGKKYQVSIEEIIAFNELEGEEIYPGEILILPGGKMPIFENFVQNYFPISKNFFICPLPPCQITQSLHWYNAVDFSNGKCGEYVLAAASGKVIFAKKGWNGGGGNTVKILHPNGVITQYCHLEEILVEKGKEVYQGEIIGTVGRNGIATGCHLHFGVFGAENPFSK